MKTMTKKTAVVALAGVMAAGMLTGCGEKELDGTKTVATVDGTEIPLGMLSLSVREGQAQAEAMYKSFMGGSDYSIWGTEAEEGKTYGEQAVEQALEDIELMCILKEKAADYDVEITEDDEKAIADAAAAFMSANTEDTLKTLAVTEDQVKTYLELETYKSRMHDPIIADVDKNVSDEEAQQSSFNYVSISTSDLSDDEIKQKKEDAQKILDGLNADPDGDFGEIAKSVDDSYTVLSASFDTNEDASEEESDDEDETTASSSNYPDEVMKVLRTLKDGEVGPDVIEADSAYYVVKLDKVNDEDATATKKESIISTRENELYTETTDKWMDEADIKVEKKVLKTLKVTDNHKFTIQTAAEDTTDETAEVTETPEVTEAADATETPEVTEAADATATPEVTEAPSYDTDSSLEVKDGDTVNIDYVGKIDDVAFDGGSTDGNGTDLVIGSGSYIDNFEEQLIGKNAGEACEVNVTFPEEYHASELAGKPAQFKVTVKEVKEKQLPELNAEFAGEVSEFETLAEYKEDIKKSLLAKKEADAKGAKEDAVIDAIVENAQMEIPDAMVETQQRQTIDEFGQRLQMQGLNLEQYFQFTGLTYEHMMEQVKPQAERRIKSRLVLEAVAAAENIEATEEDFDAEVKRMAEGYKMEADKIKELMGEAGKKQIMEDLAVRKAVDFVVSEAVEK